MRRLLPAITVAMIVLSQVPAWAESASNGCSENWTRWRETFATLREQTAQLRSMKKESITGEIERAIEERKGSLSMARVVQSVLAQWRKKIGSSTEKVSEASDSESAALSDLKRCMGRRDFTRASKSDPDLIERKKLVGNLPNLLVDEAYVQYSHHRRGRAATNGNASRGYGGNRFGPSRYGYGQGTRYGANTGYPPYH